MTPLALAGPQVHIPRGAAASFIGLAWAFATSARWWTPSPAVASLDAAGELRATVVLANMWLARDLHVSIAHVLRGQGELDAAAEHFDVAREVGDRASVLEIRHRCTPQLGTA